MTLPLTPPPSLSEAARPYVPNPLPEAAADSVQASQAMVNQSSQTGAMRERDLRERDLLGMAMATESGMAALRQLQPGEFAIPANQNVARALLDLDRLGAAHDAQAVVAELAGRPASEGLPFELDPNSAGFGGNAGRDPRETGIGAWQTQALAAETRAPILAREVRSLYRQDTLQQIAQAAITQWQQGLEFDPAGRLESDRLGDTTLDLAERLVSLPKELHPEWGVENNRSVEVWASQPTANVSTRSTPSLDLPSPPSLSPQGQRVVSARQ